MSAPLAVLPDRSRRLGRSIAAVAAAFVANAVLSLIVDQIFHILGVYPPWGQPMYDAVPNALALSYRIVFGVAAGWLVARLAPGAPMRHAVILGIIGLMFSSIGVVVALSGPELGPAWYPIALAVVSFPTVWIGAALHERRRA